MGTSARLRHGDRLRVRAPALGRTPPELEGELTALLGTLPAADSHSAQLLGPVHRPIPWARGG